MNKNKIFFSLLISLFTIISSLNVFAILEVSSSYTFKCSDFGYTGGSVTGTAKAGCGGWNCAEDFRAWRQCYDYSEYTSPEVTATCTKVPESRAIAINNEENGVVKVKIVVVKAADTCVIHAKGAYAQCRDRWGEDDTVRTAVTIWGCGKASTTVAANQKWRY